MKVFQTNESHKEMQEKYGRYNISLEILERAVGEDELHNLIKVYDEVLERSHPRRVAFDTAQHDKTYGMYKKGVPMESICEMVKVPKSRFWESVALGSELVNKKKK